MSATEVEIKAQVSALHKELTGRNMDARLSSYWISTISNKDKTLDDFMATLLTTDDYIKRMTSVFKDKYYELIGFNLDDETLNYFINHHVKGKRVTDDEMRLYITHLPKYTKKFSDLISSTYQAYTGHGCPEHIVKHYVDKFRANMDYDVDKLMHDIQIDKLHMVCQAPLGDMTSTYANKQTEFDELAQDPHADVNVEDHGDHHKKVCVMFKDIHQRDPTTDEIDTILGVIHHPYRTTSPTTNEISPTTHTHHTFNRASLQKFEHVFKRPMFVQEYFKYVVDCGGAVTDFHPLYESHVELYNRLRQLVETYVGSDLDEYHYVKNYLYKVDDPEFFFNIVDEIVESDLYSTSMKRYLKERYAALFDENLAECDIDYVFAKVKERKLSLSDDEIQTVLVDLKTETDEIVSHVFEQYSRVLERQPDEIEMNKHITAYRNKLPRDLVDIDRDTERELMASLEFHDIVKKRIRRAHIAKHGKDILTSLLYECLLKVLANLSQTTMNTIDDTIASSFA